jgi:glycosyltransferase involved in cell wall biosynthesis
MQIGIMLRSLDEKGGIGVYARYLTEELLEVDRKNHYVLFYRTSSHLGRFSHDADVTERLILAPNKAAWDQIAVPYACWKANLDVVLHPKFTVPLLAPCKAVMAVHGADWFIPEYARFYKRLDVMYMRIMMPLYWRKASVILSVSQLCTDDFDRIFKPPPGKVKTVYFGPGRHFKRVDAAEVLERARRRYQLPPRFIFTVSGYDRGPRKNIAGLLRAYQIYHEGASRTAAPKLVIAGKDCDQFRTDHGIPQDGYGKDVLFPGWVEQEDLPALYSLADCFLYPSNLETFPIPICEAMACGVPIITSNVNGLREIAGDEAAILIDPSKPEEIADALHQVLTDTALRSRLSARALVRSLNFSWGKCARETLGILEALGAKPLQDQ